MRHVKIVILIWAVCLADGCQESDAPNEFLSIAVNMDAGADTGAAGDGSRETDAMAPNPVFDGAVAAGVDLTEFTHLHTRRMRGATTEFCNVFPGDTFLCWGSSLRLASDRPNISGSIVDLKDDCVLNAAGESECRMVDGFQVSTHRVPGGPYKQIIGRNDDERPWTYYFLTEGGAWAGYDYEPGTGFNDGTRRPVPEGDGLVMATFSAGVACGLTAAGAIDCRSLVPAEPDPFGLVSTVPTEGPFVQIRRSRTTHCALSVRGEIHCWGPAPEPSTWLAGVSGFFAERFSAIDVDDTRICGLTVAGGRVRCLNTDYGRSYSIGFQAEFGPEYTQIFIQWLTSNYGVCARTPEGALTCHPEIGAKLIQGQFKDFSMSDELICGVSETGQIQCNDEGRDLLERILQPLNRSGPYEKVRVWRPQGPQNPKTNICVLDASGQLSCRDARGLDPSFLVDGHRSLRNERLSEFVMGKASGCGLTAAGRIRCVGWDYFGQVSNAPGGQGYVTLSAGHKSYCATKADGTAACWGENYGTFDDPLEYVALSPERTGTILGLSPDGDIIAYDYEDRNGRFEDALAEFRPQKPDMLATGLNTVCVLSDSGRLSCAGNRGRDIDGLESMQSGVFKKLFVDCPHHLGILGCQDSSTVCALSVDGKIACAGGIILPLNTLGLTP